MTNRLSGETSPYLLQHKDNPVHWYPWGEEALTAAREQEKPILLSVGYSACHWCHVMAHESFEDPSIAQIMNENFINIKVDREERPDIDAIYMMSVQMLTGQGGWPMTVFLTPEGKPFYGGTYYPPSDRGNMPGFPRVLQGVSQAYRDRRDAVESSAGQLAGHLQSHFEAQLPPTPLEPALIEQAVANLEKQYDKANGGFGGAPKFPPPMSIELLLRSYARAGSASTLEMAEHTLDRMARGGLYDQVGGGFHRYTVDAIWLVPHFEKMLYDNAQLALVYTLAWQVTGEQFYQTIAEETFAYVTREMTSPEGGFYSAQDADTDGEEGKFYVWTPDEITAVLGNDATGVIDLFAVTSTGNFEGANIFQIVSQNDRMRWRTDEFAASREKLYTARQERTIPGRDDKVLTSWNGLMLRAFATAAWVFDDSDYLQIAETNARFIRENLFADGRLRHSYKDGQARITGFLEDYAFLLEGILALYRATFNPEWIDWAVELAQGALAEFFDPGTIAFYDTAESAEELVSRPRDAYDSATPSGNSVICQSLLELAALTGREDLRNVAVAVLEGYAKPAADQPQGFSRLMSAIDQAVGPAAEVAILGKPDAADTKAMLDALRSNHLPRVAIAYSGDPDNHREEILPIFREREMIDGKATAYVCVGYTCRLPTTDVDEMLSQIREIV